PRPLPSVHPWRMSITAERDHRSRRAPWPEKRSENRPGRASPRGRHRRPECAHLAEIARPPRGRKRREELPAVALPMHAFVEERDDAAVFTRADQSPEALLERDLRHGHVKLDEGPLSLVLERTSAREDDGVARHGERHFLEDDQAQRLTGH